MSARSKRDEGPASLEDRLSGQVRLLLNLLADDTTSQEIEAELKKLNEMVTDFNEQDHFLAKLLDPLTRRTELWQTIRQLPDPVRANESENELNRIYKRSHELIKQSVQLMAEAQRLAEASRDLGSRYAKEICGFCEGFGGTREQPCSVCKGRRAVRVYQPARKCPRCEGTGHAKGFDRSHLTEARCVVCLGSGWAFSRQD